jgi:hypothetical protein
VTRCLDPEGKRTTVERGGEVWRGMRPNAEVGCRRGRDRQLTVHRHDRVERWCRWRGTLRRRHSRPVVVMATGGRYL